MPGFRRLLKLVRLRRAWRALPPGRRAELLALLLSLFPFRPLRWLGALLGFWAALKR
ncbi:hypothetical protein [Thermus sp.]|uniref:hypothetical protein n=1 Tax=Thermus sp. TaxID=275 RepID=UPI00307E9290